MDIDEELCDDEYEGMTTPWQWWFRFLFEEFAPWWGQAVRWLLAAIAIIGMVAIFQARMS